MAYVLLALFSMQGAGPRLDGGEILKILEGLHAPIKDLEFICEGENKWVTDTGDMFRQAPDSQSGRFQGSYAYRRDGAAYWDLYLKPFDPRARFQRNISVYLKGRRSRVYRSPGHRGHPKPVQVDDGAPDDLGAPISPQIFLYLGYWRRLDYSTKSIEIEAADWDEVDGHKTVRLTINEHPGPVVPGKFGSKIWSKYWIDLERGGHVLKHESYRGEHLFARRDRIRLAAIPIAGGRHVWLPVHGEFETFLWLKGYSDTPLFHETYDIVRGSIVLNSGLSDDRFSIEWEGRRAGPGGLDRLRREFESAPPKKSDPPSRTDPSGIEEYQKQRLQEADRQAKQLDASPPAHRGWGSSLLIPSSLAVAGAGAIATALVLRRRAT